MVRVPRRPPLAPALGAGRVGLALLPQHRGQGLGTAAQRLLVDHLFRHTTVHRLEAGTDAENLAEQKALERIGFTREGVLREVAFRDGLAGHPALRVAAPGLAAALKRAALSRCPR